MPKMNERLASVGSGFAKFLTPPKPDVIRFTVGQPDFATPASIVEAAKNALDRGETTYTRPQGSFELCQAVSSHLQRYNIHRDHDDVLITPGCKQALFYSMLTLLNPGDEVLLLSPAWPSYDGMLKLLGVVPIHVPVHHHNYHPDFDALAAAVSSKTTAIILNSPNNPTGAVYTSSEIERLTAFSVEHDLWIIDDMIYANLTWADEGYTSPTSFEGGAERTVSIGGWSKGWSMTGWRLGWITGPTHVMSNVKTVNASSATHVPTFLMPAAKHAFEAMNDVELMKKEFAKRRTLIHEGFQSLPGVKVPEPEGAFYMFCDIRGTGMSDTEFALRAMEEARVQCIPGSLMPGGEGFIRISYATSEDNINEGVRRLKQWLEQIE
jgi:aspartate/methionine/tyrosine aminotransferase